MFLTANAITAVQYVPPPVTSPTTSLYVNSRTMEFGSKLPVPLYADVRLSIPMTHHHQTHVTTHVHPHAVRSPGMLNRTPLVDVVEAKASAKELETGEQAAAAAAVEGGKVAGNEHSGAAVAAGSEVGEKEEEEEGPIAQPTFDVDVDVGVGVDDVMESVRDILGSLPKELSMPQSENNENADALGSIAAFSKKTTSKVEMKVSLSKRKTSKAALIGGSESSPRQALGGITNSPTHSPARQIKMQMAMRSASSPARKQSSLFSQLAPNASSPQMVELTSV